MNKSKEDDEKESRTQYLMFGIHHTTIQMEGENTMHMNRCRFSSRITSVNPKTETNPANLEKGQPLIKQTAKINKTHQWKLRSSNVKRRSISFKYPSTRQTDQSKLIKN